MVYNDILVACIFSIISFRNITLTFAPEQSSHQVAIEIINDNTPEVNETFDIQLLNPGGGARLGSQTSVPVTILTNDDAHGVVGFALVCARTIIRSSRLPDFEVLLTSGTISYQLIELFPTISVPLSLSLNPSLSSFFLDPFSLSPSILPPPPPSPSPLSQ